MKELNRLSALEMSKGLEAGDFTVQDLVVACLERMSNRNDKIKAFVSIEPEVALRQAENNEVSTGTGWLRGLPFGAKDVLDSADYKTEYGSAAYSGHRASSDAACIALAKSQGAVLLGKTVTCEFATTTPSPTRNPLSANHTPGGSSSGSAAAVADFMVPMAFSTQTAGSTIRPAVYCGVVGFKPTFGFFNTAGLKSLSPSLDTIGLITRSVQDAALFSFGVHGQRISMGSGVSGLRIGIVQSEQWRHARQETLQAIDRFTSRLSTAGAQVFNLELGADLEAMAGDQPRLTFYEIRHSLTYERLHCSELLAPQLQSRFSEPFDCTVEEYFELCEKAARAREHAVSLFDNADILLYPTADGEAEEGLSFTGSPRFCSIWTLLHVPSVSFPISSGPAGLPIGVQLIGPRAGDAALLAAAAMVSEFAEFRLEDIHRN